MGSMKKKRQKKLAKAWTEFQERHGLTEECRKQARSIGYPPDLLQEKLANESFDESISIADRIGVMYRQKQEEQAQHTAAIESGEIQPQPKKLKKKPAHDPQWAKAKAVCRLNMEDIRMAKELGMSPKSLMKNVPSPTQRWKAPVQVWIRDLYEQHQQRSRNKAHSGSTPPQEPRPRSEEDDHGRMIQDWKQNAERNDDENYEFLRSLKHRDYGFEPDEMVTELHEQAFAQVDCTRCANCCKTLQPEFNDEDIERIASHLQLEVAAFIETYLEAGESGTYRTRTKPCAFLGEDDRCTIYEIRPTVCRDYPYTDKEGLVFRTIGVANNTQVCPAVFWIVEQMKHRSAPPDHDYF